ncbi:hypothetical protein SCLCIDRAFT_1213978, partial [Scleroderma citrinum Foug A]
MVERDCTLGATVATESISKRSDGHETYRLSSISWPRVITGPELIISILATRTAELAANFRFFCEVSRSVTLNVQVYLHDWDTRQEGEVREIEQSCSRSARSDWLSDI